MRPIDETHDRSRTTWVPDADPGESEFPIQNLPFGVMRARPGAQPGLAVAIGESALDLRGVVEAGLLESLPGETRDALKAPVLNPLLALGREAWGATRHALFDLLEEDCGLLRDDAALRERVLHRIDAVTLLLPVAIGDYTDFYASLHHATNVGSMFRPDNPLMPNYKHLPVGYHGRASSVVVSGTGVRRPRGQVVPPGSEVPVDAACRLLDYELEMGFVIGTGNALGTRVGVDEASDHIFGLTLVNDWSARDIQKWEYQPLGPFNAKNFATTMAPWIVTLDALEPFRVDPPARGADDPALLDYLAGREPMAYDVTMAVEIASETMRRKSSEPHAVSSASFRDMYWTMAQMVAHHTSTGCNLRPGDLMASGTVSGPNPENRGCLLERTWRGEQPIALPDGTERKFLQDGDEVRIAGRCERDGFVPIGFGPCAGVIQAADG